MARRSVLLAVAIVTALVGTLLIVMYVQGIDSRATEGQELVTDSTSAFFNDAPVGEIFTNRSKGVVAQVKGPEDSNIQDNVFGPVLDSISQGEITSGDAAWEAALTNLKNLGIE